MIEPSRYFAKWPAPPLLRLGALILLTLVATMLAGQTMPVDDFRCPESYATDAERDAAIKAFVEKFSKEHPQATIDDLVGERYRRLVAHDCRQTLINIEGRRNEKVAPQLVLPHVKSLTLAGHKFERVDEYYDAATHVWSVFFVDDPQHPDSYGNQLIFNFYDWTPKSTAEAVASALSEERQGAKNIYRFKSPDGPNAEMVYHIVSVTRGRANFVNLMSVSDWDKSAVNISFGHRLGAGIDLEETESQARQWLLSAGGEASHEATVGLRVGDGWRQYLKQVK